MLLSMIVTLAIAAPVPPYRERSYIIPEAEIVGISTELLGPIQHTLIVKVNGAERRFRLNKESKFVHKFSDHDTEYIVYLGSYIRRETREGRWKGRIKITVTKGEVSEVRKLDFQQYEYIPRMPKVDN